MERVRLGILGGGIGSLIGVLHRGAAQAYNRYDIVCGCFSSEARTNINSAKVYDVSINRTYADVNALIKGEMALPVSERVEVVSVLTPNFLHYSMSKELLKYGIHVICEKPMTVDYTQALSLRDILADSDCVFAITHTYTGYPMTRQMRQMIAQGEIGDIHKIDVQYYQGWINSIIHDVNKRKTTWRLDPKKTGLSCCLGDIGVHAFNMVEFATGIPIQKVLADINTLYKDNSMDVDATILFQFSEYGKGILRCSQIATAEENNLRISVYGSKGALKWQQEQPNRLIHLQEGRAMSILKPGHSYNSNLSIKSSKLPPGHPEGIFEAMANIYKGVAKAIRGLEYDIGEFPTLQDGLRGMHFIEQSLASYREGNVWKSL